MCIVSFASNITFFGQFMYMYIYVHVGTDF